MPSQQQPLSALAEVRTGYSFRGALPENLEGSLRVLQIKDVRHQTVIEPGALTKINWDARTKPPLLSVEDIAVIARGESNRAAIFLSKEQVVATSQLFIIKVRMKSILPEYLCWVINLPQSQRFLAGGSSGTNIQAVSKAALLDMPIPVPSLDVQHKLIALQKVWDEEDQLIARLQKNREQMLKGIYQQLIEG